jgi:acetylornithine/N-succinyldiaminopimelate aminotransferase
MNTEQYIKEENKYLMHTYSRLPVCFVRGRGTRLWDVEGKEYLDLVSGLGVISIGHSHPAIVETIEEQARKLTHTSNLFYTLPQIELAEMLTTISFGEKCFFANSGAEVARRKKQILPPTPDSRLPTYLCLSRLSLH